MSEIVGQAAGSSDRAASINAATSAGTRRRVRSGVGATTVPEGRVRERLVDPVLEDPVSEGPVPEGPVEGSATAGPPTRDS